MVFKKGVVTNPAGNPNPNLKYARNTGPTTLEGKFRGALKNNMFKHGRDSKILKKIRKCKVCPLGQKTHTINIKGQFIEKTMPAKCPLYMAEETKDGEKCVLSLAHFLRESKVYYEIGQEQDTLSLQEAVIQQTIRDAMISRDTETLEKGRPGFYTKEFTKLVLDGLSDMNKLKYGNTQKHLHAHMGEDMAKEMLDEKYEKDDEEEV
jgi:hypothetical protein